MRQREPDEPCYVISVAARMLDVHPQTLRNYERLGLISPARTEAGIRLYSERDLDRVRQIIRLTEELGVNLAGAEVILNMRDRIEQLQGEVDQLRRRARQRQAQSAAGQH